MGPPARDGTRRHGPGGARGRRLHVDVDAGGGARSRADVVGVDVDDGRLDRPPRIVVDDHGPGPDDHRAGPDDHHLDTAEPVGGGLDVPAGDRPVRSRCRRTPAGTGSAGGRRRTDHHRTGPDGVVAGTGARPARGGARRSRRLSCRRSPPPRDGRRAVPQRLVTNGVATTRAGSAAPRASMTSSSPSATSGGTNARAIPCPSSGEKFPLVTTPTSTPSRRTT